MLVFLYDISDEVEAYQRGYMFAKDYLKSDGITKKNQITGAAIQGWKDDSGESLYPIPLQGLDVTTNMMTVLRQNKVARKNDPKLKNMKLTNKRFGKTKSLRYQEYYGNQGRHQGGLASEIFIPQ